MYLQEPVHVKNMNLAIPHNTIIALACTVVIEIKKGPFEKLWEGESFSLQKNVLLPLALQEFYFFV